MDFSSESVLRGIREHEASIVGSAGPVPLALWAPADAAPKGLVLAGHGGSGHKREGYIVSLARRLVRAKGFAVASIDGPVHGARRTTPSAEPSIVLMEFAQAWAADATMTDRMVADWSCVLDAILSIEGYADLPVGYWGVSMGTLLGLPFVAADDRVDVCVLGLAGMTGPTRARLEADAPQVAVPTLFLVQLGDELFTTASSLELFAAIGSAHKRLFGSPGRHRDVPADAFELSIDFLAAHLDATPHRAQEAG